MALKMSPSPADEILQLTKLRERSELLLCSPSEIKLAPLSPTGQVNRSSWMPTNSLELQPLNWMILQESKAGISVKLAMFDAAPKDPG